MRLIGSGMAVPLLDSVNDFIRAVSGAAMQYG